MSGRSRISRSVDLVPADERRIGGHDEHIGVAHELNRLERSTLEREDAETDVDLAALDELGQLVVICRLHEPHIDLRPLHAEWTQTQNLPDQLLSPLADDDAALLAKAWMRAAVLVVSPSAAKFSSALPMLPTVAGPG